MPNERRRWRKDSIFGPGPRVVLDREKRARFRFLLRAHRGSRRLTASDLDVGEVLVAALGNDGQLDLAHETIAARALCHVATVRRALCRLRDLGLVTWIRRLVRDGWRVEQTSNSYVLSVPSCDAHSAGAVVLARFKKEAREEKPASAVPRFTGRVAREARDALVRAREGAARRAALEAKPRGSRY